MGKDDTKPAEVPSDTATRAKACDLLRRSLGWSLGHADRWLAESGADVLKELAALVGKPNAGSDIAALIGKEADRRAIEKK
jgi:hypothetical protein